MTFDVEFQLDDKSFTLNNTSAAAAAAAADRAESAAETLSGTVAQIATNTQDISSLKEEFTAIGLSVVDGAINTTYQEVSE